MESSNARGWCEVSIDVVVRKLQGLQYRLTVITVDLLPFEGIRYYHRHHETLLRAFFSYLCQATSRSSLHLGVTTPQFACGRMTKKDACGDCDVMTLN